MEENNWLALYPCQIGCALAATRRDDTEWWIKVIDSTLFHHGCWLLNSDWMRTNRFSCLISFYFISFFVRLFGIHFLFSTRTNQRKKDTNGEIPHEIIEQWLTSWHVDSQLYCMRKPFECFTPESRVAVLLVVLSFFGFESHFHPLTGLLTTTSTEKNRCVDIRRSRVVVVVPVRFLRRIPPPQSTRYPSPMQWEKNEGKLFCLPWDRSISFEKPSSHLTSVLIRLHSTNSFSSSSFIFVFVYLLLLSFFVRFKSPRSHPSVGLPDHLVNGG